ncbi:MAG TPA: hypothetical protein VJV78_05620, partial [Polyangiales bacterium]|nr:hypothetical protein [Polyangiales bacterium]
CNYGETCVAGKCTCSGTLGTFYRDADGDMHGNSSMKRMACGSPPSGWVASSDDCCDSDNRAFPGQTTGFETATNCAARGFDFNCDDFEEYGYPNFASGTCCVSSQDGWATTAIPNCGETKDFQACDTNTCNVVSGTLTQVCR